MQSMGGSAVPAWLFPHSAAHETGALGFLFHCVVTFGAVHHLCCSTHWACTFPKQILPSFPLQSGWGEESKQEQSRFWVGLKWVQNIHSIVQLWKSALYCWYGLDKGSGDQTGDKATLLRFLGSNNLWGVCVCRTRLHW